MRRDQRVGAIPQRMIGGQRLLGIRHIQQRGAARLLAQRADQVIAKIQEQFAGVSIQNATILALLNMIDEMGENEKELKKLKDHFSQYITYNENERENLLRLRDLNWEMRKEIGRLRAMIENYENQLAGLSEDVSPLDKLPLEELLETIKNPAKEG